MPLPGKFVVEGTGEALAAVALLVIVLMGVLPSLVLPEGTRLRRRDHEIPEGLAALAPPLRRAVLGDT